MPIEPPEPSPSKPVTLFLSYSHSDEAKARRISSALRQVGYEVWWDELIEGGAVYARSISTALQTADVVIVLWSAAAVESDWVRDEAAQGRDRQRLVPLRIDGTRPPLGFGQYQAINFKNWRGRRDSREFVALQRAIATALGQEIPAAPRQKAHPEHLLHLAQLLADGSLRDAELVRRAADAAEPADGFESLDGAQGRQFRH